MRKDIDIKHGKKIKHDKKDIKIQKKEKYTDKRHIAPSERHRNN